MVKFILPALCLLLMASFGVDADIYRWQDHQGTWHFADTLDKVPLRYRDQMTREELPEQPEKAPLPAVQEAANDVERGPGPDKESAAITALPEPKIYKIEYTQAGNSMNVDVTLNGGRTFPFILDTGASYVVLSREVAEALGFSPRKILPRTYGITANGVSVFKLVRLDSVQMGDALVRDVVALVKPERDFGFEGLLGLNFLNEFDWSNDTMGQVLTLKEFTNSPQDELYGGANEKWWRKKFEEARKQIREIEDQLDELGKLRLKTSGKKQQREWGTKILEANLEFYREDLAILDNKANRYMVPRSWR